MKEYVVRYEIQFRGSLYAHIMLWIEHTDLERVASETTASAPTVFNSTSGNFIEPSDTEQNTLFKTMISKQLHACTSRCHNRKSHGTCKYEFLFPPHTKEQTTYNVDTRRRDYYRPRNEDRNVVPYHAIILLLWGAHINLQRVNTTYWSYYLLKYAMKCEPHGPIQLDKTNAERLGLQGASNSQLQLISSLIISKPISLAEAALACLHIPVIHKSRIVKYIDSNPPMLRTKLVTKSR